MRFFFRVDLFAVAVVGGGGGGNDDDDGEDVVDGGQWQLHAERMHQVARLRAVLVHEPIGSSSPDAFVQMAQRVGISLAPVRSFVPACFFVVVLVCFS